MSEKYVLPDVRSALWEIWAQYSAKRGVQTAGRKDLDTIKKTRLPRNA